MKTILQIDGYGPDGAGVPPHATVKDADFVPGLGDLITVGDWAVKCEVIDVVFHYATRPDRKHRVDILVRDYVESPGPRHT